MFRVSVVNNVDGRTFRADFEDEAAANSWVSFSSSQGYWGNNEKSYSEYEITEMGLDPVQATSVLMPATPGELQYFNGKLLASGEGEWLKYTFPKEFSVTGPIDVSAEYDMITEEKNIELDEMFGHKCVKTIRATFRIEMREGNVSAAVVDAAISDIMVLKLEKLFRDGYIPQAKTALENDSFPAIFTQQMKDELVAKINAYLGV